MVDNQAIREKPKRILKMVWILAIVILFLFLIVWYLTTQPTFSGEALTRSISPDPGRLETHVRMLSEAFGPRDWTHPENLDRTAAYIRKEFEQAGGVVSDQAFGMENRTYRNVMANFGPETKERIVVGAHYDAFGELPAADDNASGVAGLIELAHGLGKSALPIRIELVAFTLEEPKAAGENGLFRSRYGGSAVHAASISRENVPVRVMFSLEMIGFFSDAEGSQGYPVSPLRMFYPSRGDFILIVGKLGQGRATRKAKKAMHAASTLPVYSINALASIEGIDYSDHYNYWKYGYDALMITDTAFNRNRNYHTEHDTFDRLDYQRMAMVVQGVYAAVLAFAQ